MRRAVIHRKTKETRIDAVLNIDGRGRYNISTGIRFFDHMLELFAHHGGFDLELKAIGDLDVDQHHTVEDVGIVLGQAFAERWEISAASFVPAISSCPWTKPWDWPRLIFPDVPPP